ncbi:UDP:flavonoid glycosyltransferase YjiC, YdhE family [Micromonospora citrea]|uniref:UDP:flavonoid glycosyltransferase YjiC, YdhE family n=1 Tax=Micromonospora citrea TaxID=47855 RepID=A0A1C6VJB8_9ACTN|nr:glycosyltransferase [Micromonospora citrea]SCL66448.1 UDP:flavonoid glycosyltransferase YjiC, YdhE family [Micromonospora citrea]
MRVLLSTLGSRGDVQPLVALASRLKALGLQVRLCAPPDFARWVATFRIPFVPVGPPWRRSAAPTARAAALRPSPARLRQLAESSVAVQFEVLSGAAGDCDVLVASTGLQIAARTVAERRGIPYVYTALCPAALPSPHHPPPPLPLLGEAPAPASADNGELWAANLRHVNDTFAAPLNALRTAVGLVPVDDVSDHIHSDQPWLAADPTLAPWPEAADPTVYQPGAWLLPDERALPAELTAFLEAGGPCVYVGFGSVAAPPGLLETALRAVRAVGCRLVVSRGWAPLAPVDRAPDCVVVGEVNQQALFGKVAAVVHHGGSGTTTTAALAGTPQVVIPQVYDQHYFARRVCALGIGSAHPGSVPTVESLTAVLGAVLRPEVAARARAFAAVIRTDGAQAAAQRLTTALGA